MSRNQKWDQVLFVLFELKRVNLTTTRLELIELALNNRVNEYKIYPDSSIGVESDVLESK
jgi:hypothetical protein